MKLQVTRPLIVLALSLLLLPAIANAGTCLGGARSGQSCNVSYECGTCNAGPFAGFSCGTNPGLCGRYCSGGVRRGFSCSTSLDCQGFSCVSASCVGFCSSFLSARSECGEDAACPEQEAVAAAVFQQDSYQLACAAPMSQP